MRNRRTVIVYFRDDGEGRRGAFDSFADAQAADPSVAIGWQEVTEHRARWLLTQGSEVVW